MLHESCENRPEDVPTASDADEGSVGLDAENAVWYPSASRYNPATYCYVVGTRDRPVRLIDANDGRFLGPTCMAFNNDATKLYCGHDTAIEVFDFSQPGAEGSRIKLSPSRKSKDGQKGIVSAIAFSPDTSSGMFAVGTFKGGRISCYSEDTGDERLLELELGTGGAKIDGQGYTQVRLTWKLPHRNSLEQEAYSRVFCMQLAFHPLNPYVLFSASRQSDYISVYDIRNPSYGPYLHLHRPGMTQQRLGFDIDWAGRTLTTGATDGTLRVYDINPPVSETPVLQQAAHDDAIGSVALHPFKPWILTAHGSRKPSAFEKSLDAQSESDSETGSSEDESSSSDDSSSNDDSEEQVNDSISGQAEDVGKGGEVAESIGKTSKDAADDPQGDGEPRPYVTPTLPRDSGWIGAIEICQFS
ncbi:hypothetical protein QFC21_003180 [Naganishia friedmannii]|uniref:Uncharacterized protein n=1 Tax=Naganishia friedmannii TaxID=89922 RepID=A0ACC2VS01_9TREE|nr:hypothetical protein QFC21_003180 [Naganishia friedmannii]